MLRDKKNKTVNIKMWQKYVGMWPRAIVRLEVGGTIRARCERSCAILRRPTLFLYRQTHHCLGSRTSRLRYVNLTTYLDSRAGVIYILAKTSLSPVQTKIPKTRCARNVNLFQMSTAVKIKATWNTSNRALRYLLNIKFQLRTRILGTYMKHKQQQLNLLFITDGFKRNLKAPGKRISGRTGQREDSIGRCGTVLQWRSIRITAYCHLACKHGSK